MKLLSALPLALSIILVPALAISATTTPKPEKLASGVLVEHVKQGNGTSPKASDSVSVHYRGTLADGKEFDSSYKRGAPATFPLNRVVPCWTDGVQKLKEGGKAILTCPPNTAYGASGVPGTIPPNSTLTFQIELIKVNP